VLVQSSALQQQPSIIPMTQQATNVAQIRAIPASKLKLPNTLEDCVVALGDCVVALGDCVVVPSCVTMTPIWLFGTVGTVVPVPGANVPAGEVAHASGIGGT